MRWLAVLLLALSSAVSAAPPPCVPGIYGVTLDVAAPKRYDAGWRLAWICAQGEYAVPVYVACVHGTCSEQVFRDAIYTAVMSSDPAATMKATWAKTVTLDCVVATGNGRIICDQAKADAFALLTAFVARHEAPAPEVWKVALNGTYTTRPTYAWANGVRSTTAAAERVAVGALCNAAVGTGSYRGVLGRTDRVALCAKQ